ncbi:hypothetical protein P3X46_005380 [Hevea brasiliensis]|uniref:RNase H type-1 domain-containing protein n=1 Tax=Hevea brasiliensis TaxID=3981 RepID=A0ABQ9N209_HEVBR|nr:hypothetical protein P3X46_005380 [Hevea brasiliensis]
MSLRFVQAASLSRCTVPGRCSDEIQISWSPPPINWVKLNTDGSVVADSNLAVGLFRDANGFWLAGFGLNLDACDIYSAELWGILQGLQLAWQYGFRQLVVKVDNMAAVNAGHLVDSIQDLLAKD